MFLLRIFLFLILLLIFFIPFIITFILVFLFIDKKVFFIQKRIGHKRKVFKFIKFASMKNNNSQDKLLKYEHYRINSIGRFIRRVHLDEIPQIFNILKGEMNFIGPRPWSISHDQIYLKLFKDNKYLTNKYYERSNIKPGIIGLAQLKNLNQETKLSIAKRLKYDLFFTRNQSFDLNAFIILSTIKKVLKNIFKL